MTYASILEMDWILDSAMSLVMVPRMDLKVLAMVLAMATVNEPAMDMKVFVTVLAMVPANRLAVDMCDDSCNEMDQRLQGARACLVMSSRTVCVMD